MEIITNVTDRKKMVKALAEHFGERQVYLGPPTFSYQVGNITVDREGKLTFENEAMADEIRTVLNQNEMLQMDETEDDMEVEDTTSIKIPIGDMTLMQISNLIKLIHAKQHLINRSVIGARFQITDEFIERLDDGTFTENQMVANFITEHEADCGVTLDGGCVIFDGFPYSDDCETVRAYAELAAAIVKTTKEKKRINPQTVMEENEKYYMRAWLVSIGFGGKDKKELRTFFLKNLKGHTAFRTPEDEEKWKAARKTERGSTVCSD